jgi:cyanophycinase-like exopeptidase
MTALPGKLAVIGGRLEDDNAAIYGEMRRLLGGRILVFSTASAEPVEVAAETVAAFRSHGVVAEPAPLHAGPGALDADDPALAALIAAFGSVYFTGGDQAKITGALAPGGRETATRPHTSSYQSESPIRASRTGMQGTPQ